MDLDNLETQSLLDPADTSLDFVSRKEGAGAAKPIAIYRFNGLFLLCYDEFAFFVNKNGWRAKHDWMVSWEGLPQGCGTDPNFPNLTCDSLLFNLSMHSRFVILAFGC